MNFNFSTDDTHNNEYELFRSTSEEMINLYGIKIRYLITKKVNLDHIFGEHSHIKISNDDENIFTLFAKPETTDTWGGDGDLFSKFGLQSLDTISLYVSRTDMERIHPEIANREGKASISNLPHGNLIIFESNKIMEVTDLKLQSSEFGNNNIYDSDLTKNVYKMTAKSYFFNHDDLSDASDISSSDNFDYEDFGNLESIFSDEEEQRDNVTHRSEEKVLEDETIYPSTVRKKPIRDKTAEVKPFSDF